MCKNNIHFYLRKTLINRSHSINYLNVNKSDTLLTNFLNCIHHHTQRYFHLRYCIFILQLPIVSTFQGKAEKPLFNWFFAVLLLPVLHWHVYCYIHVVYFLGV
jgi:hypothetical protein